MANQKPPLVFFSLFLLRRMKTKLFVQRVEVLYENNKTIFSLMRHSAPTTDHHSLIFHPPAHGNDKKGGFVTEIQSDSIKHVSLSLNGSLNDSLSLSLSPPPPVRSQNPSLDNPSLALTL